MKRAFDIIMSLCAIIVLSPVFLITALLVLSADGAPVIYKQKRVGKDAKLFTIYKFRTMRKDAEKNGIPRTEEERKGQMTRI